MYCLATGHFVEVKTNTIGPLWHKLSIEYNSDFKYSDFSLPPQKESVKIIDKDNLEELINNLKNDSKVI